MTLLISREIQVEGCLSVGDLRTYTPEAAVTTAQAPAVKWVAALTGLSPAQSEEYARTHHRLNVHDYVPRTSHDGAPGAGKCEWSSHTSTSLTPEEGGALAWVLIDTIMRVRFGLATAQYYSWRAHTLNGTKLSPPDTAAIAAFIEPVFGLPTKPKDTHHLHGHIAEWLLHLLTKNNAAVRLQPDPKGDVTDAGADAFSIYENSAGALRFRLWESKKNTGSGPLSGSLSTAYKQIDEHGQRYVGKLVSTFQPGSHSAGILDLIAQLPAAWVEGDALVGAGVSVATHQTLSAQPFNKMSEKLPRLSKPGQLRGLATSISCYAELAETVRRYAWTAL
ncbi:hypothetical protein CH275_20945 [Rhodococcus sp. 06-235-1A]|uniref:hypothetical protein n=1 Tax=Rhodococcus sp. 06-235-1A TaxID=2022508 RepID=UPI000B9B3198|nr:hypothetical protein [Rhodococcus sp. 06-235-1A]OZD01185.1 hypothetical protein CH275_20945 [Rhodococcus sp. 06-235-1A]